MMSCELIQMEARSVHAGGVSFAAYLFRCVFSGKPKDQDAGVD